jgi:arylsulfatase A-like enzyme
MGAVKRTPWTAPSLLVLALFVAVAVADATSSALAQSPMPPNVLIIVTDDQRGGLNVMGETRRWFAEGGTRYPAAFATTPLCCPSRASILTGRYAHNHGVRRNGPASSDNLDQRTTLAYYLDQAGYRTGLFGKFLNGWDVTQAPPHFDEWALMLYAYYGGQWNVNGTVQTIDDYSTTYIADKAEAFLRAGEQDPNQPWFLYVATTAPKPPYTPGPRYADHPVSQWAGNPRCSNRTGQTNRCSCRERATASATALRPAPALTERFNQWTISSIASSPP